jgi:translation initiation factor IF-3
VESQPKQDGRNMIMVIGPHRKKSETKAHAGQSHRRSVPSPRAAAPAAPEPAASEPAASEPAADGAAVPGPA